ncbi:acyl-CoA thioester hydrolase/BAAT C-terminal domain-containing protein [Undibacterium cyanobacteriorum]|uniref:Acyl-CoA thioester hydrolase/BAAT C-terminal domain-containing protein n=1 Tax=Undibacterium cyanobacteriorum TaxID=3073561 RepID=A0ABY9RKT6_9BURK|nr:acyl-CoA thioester hydrolase/BAAT C-terminal domain-containing protein [Undibacterium sp. 20NA77.5]WMW81828.1 acyl-CoA thioester hydrolase/BAAT C-terminal domain-containing protein [Undibacterium sp. 20NA77.5]
MQVAINSFVKGIVACAAVVGMVATLGINGQAQAQSSNQSALPERHGQVSQQLFLGKGKKQPLIVGLGGSEGGNPWASNFWKAQRERFLEQGYAVLAVGYFGTKSSPAQLDRIALEGIHAAVMQAADNEAINRECIIVMGGSRGGELSLLLASLYKEYDAAIGIVAGSSVFPALTMTMDTPGWTHHGKLLPFVPVSEATYPALMRRDLRAAFSTMMKDKKAMEESAIAVEKINGPVMFLSAKSDEMWPSAEMSDMMVQRLKEKQFAYPVQHIAIDGGHTAPLKHFAHIESFLAKELAQTKAECIPQ